MKKELSDTEKIKVSKPLGPYDIITMMFTDHKSFSKLSDSILERNFFIINRVFSIKYPLQAELFNKNTINMANVIKCWAIFISNKEGYGKVPYFVYTKGSKKSIESNKSKKVDKDIIYEYCKRYSINLKDFDHLQSMFYDELMEDIKRFEKLISVKEQEKNISKK